MGIKLNTVFLQEILNTLYKIILNLNYFIILLFNYTAIGFNFLTIIYKFETQK